MGGGERERQGRVDVKDTGVGTAVFDLTRPADGCRGDKSVI